MVTGISIIICCYNSEKRLPKVLEHLSCQETKYNIDWEIIVVDNSSKDNTSEVAKSSWNRKDVPLQVIYEPKPGLSYARTTGINNSKYEIICFIDDDNWVENKWIQKIYTIMSNNPDVAICGGRGEAAFESSPPGWFTKFQDAYAVGSQYNYRGLLVYPDVMLYGAGITIRKKVIKQLFDNNFEFLLSGRKGKKLTSGDDSELCYAVALAGYKLFHDPNLKFEHYLPDNRLSWNYMVNLTKSFGRSAVILNLYNSIYNNHKGLDKLKYQNACLGLLYYSYAFIRKIPGYIKSIFTGKEGNRNVSSFIYNMYALFEKTNTIFIFKKYVDCIKKAKWKNINEE